MIDGEHRARGLTQQYVKSNSWHVLIILETFSPPTVQCFNRVSPQKSQRVSWYRQMTGRESMFLCACA